MKHYTIIGRMMLKFNIGCCSTLTLGCFRTLRENMYRELDTSILNRFKLFTVKRMAAIVLALMLCTVSVVLAETAGTMSRPQPMAAPGAQLMGKIVQTDYVLGPGDIISVEDEVMGPVNGQAKVLSDGSVNLKLVGKVYVGGLTVEQAKDVISLAFDEFYVNPSINIEVTFQRPVRVYVKGAVVHPGVYDSGKSLLPENLDRRTLGVADPLKLNTRFTLTDALMQSGGLSYNADVADIRVVRTFPRQQVIHVNLWDLFAGNVVQDFELRDQDVIEVTEIPKEQLVMNKGWEELLRSNISASDFRVHVYGSVIKPGTYVVKPQDNVLAAIAQAGGVDELARKSKVYIMRKNSAGQVFVQEINLTNKHVIRNKPLDEVARLLPDDVVFVEDSKAKKFGRTAAGLGQQAFGAASFAVLNQLVRSYWLTGPDGGGN